MTRAYPNSLKRQRGAIGLVGVMTLMLAVLFTALAVDSGRLWMQKRHLQTVADIASIQAARQLGCGVTQSSLESAAQAAADANGFDSALGYKPLLVEMVDVSTDANGVRQYTTSGSEGVYVQVTREVPASLVAGGLLDGTVVLSAEAVSRADPAIAAFSAGTFAASLNTEDSVLLNAVLGDLLGSSLNLSAVSYEGIATTNITLNDLLTASGQVGGLESLLNTQMSLANLVGLTADAMSASGTADATVIAAMQQLADATVNNASVSLGEVLAVTTPDTEAAGKVGINALSLLTTTALVANGHHAISIPSLTVSAGSLTTISAQIDIISPPEMAIGPASGSSGTVCTTVTTAQVEAKAFVDVNIPLLAKIDLALNVTVAQGSAGLSTITNDGSQTHATILANPGIASFSVTNSAGSGPGTIKTLGNVQIATIGIDLPVASSSAQPLVFDVDHPVADSLPQTQTVSSPLGDSLEDALDGSVLDVNTVLPLVNGVLVNQVVSTILSPLLGEIGRVLLDPLLKMLGIRVGGMDVTLEGVQLRQEKPLII